MALPEAIGAPSMDDVWSHGGATSRDLGRGLDGKALGLIRSQPHLSDFDVAKALGWKLDPYRVRALREGVSQDHQSAA